MLTVTALLVRLPNVAVIVALPRDCPEIASKDAMPVLPVIAVSPLEKLATLGLLEVNVTVCPTTGLPFWSVTVTCRGSAVLPLSGTVEAPANKLRLLGAPAVVVKVTVVVTLPTVKVSVVEPALIPAVPSTVANPEELVVAVAGTLTTDGLLL